MSHVASPYIGKPGRIVAGLLGLLAIAAGFAVPLDWFLPADADKLALADPLIGGRLFRDCLFANGAFLLLVALAGGWLPSASPLRSVLLEPKNDNLLTRRTAIGCLAGITSLGLILRFLHLNSGLWLDEISPVVRYGDMTFLQVLSTYLGSDNHLLNTLLVNLSMTIFGSSEWAIRLPATFFGIATIPLFYGVARFVANRRLSLGAALLLAVSYHHIFFSQNARGYSAYLVLSLAGTLFLLLALRTQRIFYWLAYVVCMVLATASLLSALFVIAAHALLCVTSVFVLRRAEDSPWQALIRLGFVFGGLALLILQVYAPVIPQVQAYMATVYHAPSAGFASPVAPEFVHDLFHGISAGWLMSGAVILPLLAALLLAGTCRLFKINGLVAGALIFPCVLFGCFVLARSLHVTPRLFLLALFPAILAVILGIDKTAQWLASRFHWPPRAAILSSVIVAALALASVSSLPAYYARPKQDYAGAVRFLENQRKDGDPVIVVYLAEQGYKFYAARIDPAPDLNCFFVRDPALFDQIIASHPNRQIWLVTTFERALRIDYPAITQEIHATWQPAQHFPGTVADGDVTVYRLKSPSR